MRFHRPQPLSTRPRVSVVVPCYRYGHFLPEAVGSALDQEGVDVDVIVVDDASDDGSAEVARALAARDDRVRVVVHATNAGHVATFNEGLGLATGDLVVLLSADDVLVDGSLARSAALLQHHRGVGMVYGHSVSFSETAPRDLATAPRSWSTWRGEDWFASMCRRAKNPVYTPGVVMRRAAWEEVGPYDARVPAGSDMLLWYRTATRWGIGRVNNGAQALYRVHGSNMHLTQYHGLLADLREQREVVRLLFDEPSGPHRPPEVLREAAHRSLARRAMRLALAELREADDDEAALAYRAFADETLALIGGRGPARWQHRADAWLEARSAGLARRIERHLEWRVWRRYGT